MTPRLQNLAFALTMVLLIGTAVGLQAARDSRFPQAVIDNRLLYVTSGEFAKKLALSYDALLADVYWIRALQHYGRDRRSNAPKRYDLLFPLLDLTTSLDPHFALAYRFGAIFLMEPFPGGAERPDLAIRLLEKGIRQTPDRWEYYLDIGFVYYWRLSDYKKAAMWFQRGGDRPNGPWWLRTYAAVMLAKGGDRPSSRFLWQNFYETADNDWMKQNAERRLLQLDALDQIDKLQVIVREYQRRRGELPRSWSDVVVAGLLPAEPLDPLGIAYLLDADTGTIRVSPSSNLSPLPVEPPPITPRESTENRRPVP